MSTANGPALKGTLLPTIRFNKEPQNNKGKRVPLGNRRLLRLLLALLTAATTTKQ